MDDTEVPNPPKNPAVMDPEDSEPEEYQPAPVDENRGFTSEEKYHRILTEGKSDWRTH